MKMQKKKKKNHAFIGIFYTKSQWNLQKVHHSRFGKFLRKATYWPF